MDRVSTRLSDSDTWWNAGGPFFGIAAERLGDRSSMMKTVVVAALALSGGARATATADIVLETNGHLATPGASAFEDGFIVSWHIGGSRDSKMQRFNSSQQIGSQLVIGGNSPGWIYPEAPRWFPHIATWPGAATAVWKDLCRPYLLEGGELQPASTIVLGGGDVHDIAVDDFGFYRTWKDASGLRLRGYFRNCTARTSTATIPTTGDFAFITSHPLGIALMIQKGSGLSLTMLSSQVTNISSPAVIRAEDGSTINRPDIASQADALFVIWEKSFGVISWQTWHFTLEETSPIRTNEGSFPGIIPAAASGAGGFVAVWSHVGGAVPLGVLYQQFETDGTNRTEAMAGGVKTIGQQLYADIAANELRLMVTRWDGDASRPLARMVDLVPFPGDTPAVAPTFSPTGSAGPSPSLTPGTTEVLDEGSTSQQTSEGTSTIAASEATITSATTTLSSPQPLSKTGVYSHATLASQGSSVSDSPPSESSVGGIVGGVVAAVCVALVSIAAYFSYRQRMHQHEQEGLELAPAKPSKALKKGTRHEDYDRVPWTEAGQQPREPYDQIKWDAPGRPAHEDYDELGSLPPLR